MVRITSFLTITSVCVGSASWLIPGANALIPKLFGINYNARIGPDWAEDAKKCKSAHEIKLDMEVLSKVASIVRLYSLTDCNQGALVIPAAINAGMNVSVGLWVNQDDTVFQAEKKKLQELIKPERKIFRDDWIFDIHVGSEAIYRKEVTVAKNIEYLKEIKAICTENNNTASIPVTIADIGDTYLEHEELIDAVDIVSANGFPFWEKTEIAVAAEHFRVRMEPLFKLAKSKNKEVFISETGWASGGASIKSSAASPASALKYFKDFYSMANANSWKYFYFEAFDEDWKVAKGAAAENDTVEAHFGLFYANRTLKEVFQTLSVTESADVTLEGSSTTATSTSNGATTSTAASAGANANGKDKCST